jgi:proteasome lid subunit RPN8/RPN11
MRIFRRTPWADARPTQRVIFSERAHAAIVAETHEQHPNETGGILLGHHLSGSWHVIEAIDPGPGSHFSPVTFEYDTAYVNHLARKMADRYERPLRLIGLWHRHPGSNNRFSHDDDITNRRYALQAQEGAISCLVNLDPHFRITAYHVPHNLHYRPLPYHLDDRAIPADLLELRRPSCLRPDRLEARRQQQTLRHLLASPSRILQAGALSPAMAALVDQLLKQLEQQQRFAYALQVRGPSVEVALVQKGGSWQQRLQIREDRWGTLRIQAEGDEHDHPFEAERFQRLLQGVRHG